MGGLEIMRVNSGNLGENEVIGRGNQLIERLGVRRKISRASGKTSGASRTAAPTSLAHRERSAFYCGPYKAGRPGANELTSPPDGRSSRAPPHPLIALRYCIERMGGHARTARQKTSGGA